MSSLKRTANKNGVEDQGGYKFCCSRGTPLAKVGIHHEDEVEDMYIEMLVGRKGY